VPTSANAAADEGAKRSPRDRLLEAASELFYAEGVQSVGINRVIERAGVAKDSLYSTFGSKEELVCAYLNARHEQTLARLRLAVAATEDPIAAAGAPDPALLASQLQLLYDGGGLAAKMDRNHGIATPARAAASALIAAALPTDDLPRA
jgi:AcrR family transcriptional regulator